MDRRLRAIVAGPPRAARAPRDRVRLQLLVELWTNQDQMDLHLPPELLSALGAAGIDVYALSNE